MTERWTLLQKLIWLKATVSSGAAAIIKTVTGNAPITLTNAVSKRIHALTQYGKVTQPTTQSELPSAYKRVLGFSCDNNAMWAITGFKLQGSDTVRISFSVNAACNVFGCYQGADATDNYDLYVSTTAGSKYFRYANGTYLSYWSSDNIGKRFNVVFTPTGSRGMPQDSTWTEATFTSANDLLIGATTLTGSSAKIKGNLYGNIVVDGRLKLVPCERVSDGVLGYYDVYSQTFFPPAEGFDGAVSLGYASLPNPDDPLGLVCNNGRVVAGNCISDIPDGQGTFITPSELTTNRIYKALPTDLVVGRSYTVTVTGTNWLVLVQQKKPDGTGSSNVSGWVTTYDFTPEEGYIYGVAMRRSQDAITPADFNGTLTLDTTDGKPWAAGTPEVLTVSGVNLCNPDFYQGDGWFVGPNDTVANANANGTLVMPCKPNTTYSWWHTAGAGGCRAFELPTETVTKGQEATWAVGSPVYDNANVVKKCTTSATAKTLCIAFARVDSNVGRTIEEQLADFMLVEGDITTATAYEPYVTPQTVNDVPMLLSVGDYADEAEIINGIKTGKVGVKVLDGTESIGTSNACFTIAISDRAASKTALLCSHFPYSSKTSSQTGDQTIISFSSTNIGFRYDACADKTAFAAFLAAEYAAGTPVIVMYPLAEETTETVAGHALNTTDGTNIITVTAEVSDIDLRVEYSGAA